MQEPSQRWQRLEALFHEASELGPVERKAFLDSRCSDDTELRSEVESLLLSADAPMDFLHKPIAEAAGQVMTKPKGQALQPGMRFARYQIVSRLGAGGMGEVYLAYDAQLRRNVALKLLAPELTQNERGLHRFEHEAHAASALNHPNILTIYEFGQADGVRYIASEFIEGQTLRQLVVGGPLEMTTVLDIAIQIASALAAAHERGIVHRDIKPDNVIVRTDGLVKVLDFGIAKLGEGAAAAGPRGATAVGVSTSQPGTVVGTVRYMSPEQARGMAVDGRSDLFSLGVVIYELITGEPAFQGQTASDVIAEILKGEPPRLSQLASGPLPEIEAIVEGALRKDRDQRYQTAKQMQRDLENLRKEREFRAKLQASGQGKGAVARPSRPVSAFNASRKQAWMLVAAALAIAIAGGFGFWHKQNPGSSSNTPRSLAVLPFRNLKPDPQTDFLGFSLADAITTKLGYVSALSVRPSSSVDKYRNQIIDPKKVAAELNVDTLLTGSYLRDGDDLRITAQLIDVKPDKIVWQDSMDVKYERLLTVQDVVSQQILKGLEVSLSPAEAANLRPERPINSLAYEYYLRGVDLYALNDFPAAIRMLEQSAALAPDYAPTWAHLGRAYTTNASLQFGGREQYAKAQAAYEKAIALNPALIESRIYMANLLTDTGRVEQAVPLLRSVLETNPTYAEAHWELGYAYRFGGMLEDSAKECELARQNNPQVKINSSALNAYLYLGEYQKFLQSLPLNDSVYVLFYHGFGEYYLGNREQAARDFDRAFEQDPALLQANVGKALSDGIRHDNQTGLRLLHETERRILDRGVSDAEGLYKVAQAYAVLGDKAAALGMLRRSIEGGFFSFPYFQRDPLLDSLRQEPEFQSLMEQARQRHEQFKARFFPSGGASSQGSCSPLRWRDGRLARSAGRARPARLARHRTRTGRLAA